VALGTKRNRGPHAHQACAPGLGAGADAPAEGGGKRGCGGRGDDSMRKSWEQLGFTGSPGDSSTLCPASASPAEAGQAPAARGGALPVHPLAHLTRAGAAEAAGAQREGQWVG